MQPVSVHDVDVPVVLVQGEGGSRVAGTQTRAGADLNVAQLGAGESERVEHRGPSGDRNFVPGCQLRPDGHDRHLGQHGIRISQDVHNACLGAQECGSVAHCHAFHIAHCA